MATTRPSLDLARTSYITDNAVPPSPTTSAPYSHSIHSRVPSGGNDNANNFFPLPDSFISTSNEPVNINNKSILHDLAEDPNEIDNSQGALNTRDRSMSFMRRDDAVFQSSWTRQSTSDTLDDYDLSDGYRIDYDTISMTPHKSRASRDDERNASGFRARLSQRMPSLTRKLKEKKSITSLNMSALRSTPASRAPSIRSLSISKSVVSMPDTIDLTMDPMPIIGLPLTQMKTTQRPPSYISLSEVVEPIDRKELVSTPLLPPCMMERHNSDTGIMQSPLQSPTVADWPTFSFPSSVRDTSLTSTVDTPSLSSNKSTTSLDASRDSQQMRHSLDLGLQYERLNDPNHYDPWADQLGHANFNIFPAPYVPVNYDLTACRSFINDWEAARKQYLSHATLVRDDFGPTSNTLKVTEQKWASIDAQWKQNYDGIIARAHASGINTEQVPCLSECKSISKQMYYHGSEAYDKSIALADNGQIVGPMVTYVSRIKPVSKKSAFMRFFSDLRLSGN